MNMHVDNSLGRIGGFISTAAASLAKAGSEKVAAAKTLSEEQSELSPSGAVAKSIKLSDRPITTKRAEKTESVLVRTEFEEAANDLLEKHPEFLEDNKEETKNTFLGKLRSLEGKITPQMSDEDIFKEVENFCKNNSQQVAVVTFLTARSSDAGVKNILSFVGKACEFRDKNPEFAPSDLFKLSKDMKPGMSKKDVLDAVENKYDPKRTKNIETFSLIHKALQFLQETAPAEETVANDERLQTIIGGVRKEFYMGNREEIITSRNIEGFIQGTAKGNVGQAKVMRDFHNHIKGDTPEPNAIINEIITKFPFREWASVSTTMDHTLGEECKFKNFELGKRGLPEAGELSALMNERKAMMAFNGVVGFITKSRMPLIESQIEDLKGG